MKKAIFVILVVGVLTATYFQFNQQQQRGGRPPFGGSVTVNAQPVTPAPLVKVIEALGTTRANESVTLTASISDKVQRVNFEDGDYVEAGDILVELSNEESALLAEARANLDEANRQLNRLEDLDQRGIAATSDVDMARSAAKAARARLDSVIARLDDRLVRAPFSGVLGFREVSPGSLLQSGDPITTLDDVSQIKLDFTIPETVLNQMTPGSRIIARSASWGDREFTGTVSAIGSRIDPVTRAVAVRALISNEDRALRPGMLLTVRVVTDERMALMVPERIIVQVSGSAYVYVVDEEQIARRKNVELGTRQGGNVEILSGLQAGERVVLNGVIKLRDGVPVELAGEQPAAMASKKGPPAQGRPGTSPR